MDRNVNIITDLKGNKIVLKNRRLLPEAFSGDVTYARTSILPKMFVRTRRTAI